MTNVELAQSLYESFAKGDVPTVLGAMSPDIEWRECPGLVYAKQPDGISIGPQAILNEVFIPLMGFADGFRIEITDLFGAGDKVVMQGFYHGTNKASGNVFKANATHVWTIKDGKLTHFFQAVDSAIVNR